MPDLHGRACIICGEQFNNLNPLLRIPEHAQQGEPKNARAICTGSGTHGRSVRPVDDNPPL